MSILYALQALMDRIERRLERRGRDAYVPEKDPDIRGLRLQRRQSERAEQHSRRHFAVDGLTTRAVVPVTRREGGTNES